MADLNYYSKNYSTNYQLAVNKVASVSYTHLLFTGLVRLVMLLDVNVIVAYFHN